MERDRWRDSKAGGVGGPVRHAAHVRGRPACLRMPAGLGGIEVEKLAAFSNARRERALFRLEKTASWNG